MHNFFLFMAHASLMLDEHMKILIFASFLGEFETTFLAGEFDPISLED